MADIKGTNVASKIVPYTTSDNYATHDEEYGRGGYRTVNTVTEMNAIPADRRKEGMLVYVKNDKYYRLNSSNTFVDAGIGSSGGSGLDWDSGSNLAKNGYQKFNNGLMLQWGYTQGAGSGSGKTVYMPTSFIDSTYNVQSAGILQNTNERIVYSPSVYTKGTSYFTIYTRYIGQGSTNVDTTAWNFEWFAIGRWK